MYACQLSHCQDINIAILSRAAAVGFIGYSCCYLLQRKVNSAVTLTCELFGWVGQQDINANFIQKSGPDQSRAYIASSTTTSARINWNGKEFPIPRSCSNICTPTNPPTAHCSLLALTDMENWLSFTNLIIFTAFHPILGDGAICDCSLTSDE